MRQILLFFFISLLACSLSAEPFIITGKVVDAEDNEPMIGAGVVVVGTHRGTATDGDGNFSIEVEKGEFLKFSFMGYYEKVVEVLNDSSLVVEMKAGMEIIVDYGGIHRHFILPDNHLKSSLRQIQSLYPDLIQWNDTGNMPTYKSEKGNMMFSMYNGIVYKQYYSFDHYTKYLEDLYHDFANCYMREEGYESYVESQTGKAITFYYPEYSVVVQCYPYDHISITCELYSEYYK